MRKMKDSGIEWIGKIPDIWRQTKLKYVTKIRSENGMYSPEQDSYIGLENIVSRSNKLIETETIYESALYSICKKGDILFNKLRPYLAKAIISPIDGFCTGELLNIKHFDGEKRFLWYYLLSDKFIEVVNASTYGAKMPRANTDFILNLPVFLPSLSEQTKIADFLDGKCADIDRIKADIEKQIEILTDYKKSVITEAVTKGLNPKSKMKDSGVEWIGKIPEGWDSIKAKYLFKQRNSRGNTIDLQLLSPSQKFGVIPQSKLEELTTQKVVKLNEKVNLAELKTIHQGDFCISLRSFQGGFEYSEYEGVVSPAYQVFYSIVSCCNGYYRYLFKEKSFIEKMNSFTMSLRDGKNIAFEDFANSEMPVPPLPEQKAIADYLDEKCSAIDATIAEKKKQLKTLEEYKKSLIFEYVTGKKEVPA